MLYSEGRNSFDKISGLSQVSETPIISGLCSANKVLKEALFAMTLCAFNNKKLRELVGVVMLLDEELLLITGEIFVQGKGLSH